MLSFLPILIFWAPPICAAIVIGLMASIASFELLYRTGLLRHLRLNIYSAVMAFLVCMWSYYGCNRGLMLLGLLVYYVLLFGEMMASHVKLQMKDALICVLSGMIFPYMISSLLRILMMENGEYLVLMPFILAILSDTGAYFVGITLGKHKLCPIVSPKKTVEGLIGGVVTAVIGMMLYAFIISRYWQVELHQFYVLIYGVVGALGGVFGDLSLSVIKRQTGIKDYGNLIPGHGGILDRFDSVMITAPLTEALLLILPLVV